MKAEHLQAYLRSLNGGWVDPQNTVDTFKSGDPGDEVHGIAVGWMSYGWALRQAVALGCNVFLTHEPTYFSHRDDAASLTLAAARDKRRFIEENGLIVLRCHDLWDQMPGIGVPDSWAEFLGLGPVVDGEGHLRVLDVGGRTAIDVAGHVAARVAGLGQRGVELIGPVDRPVTRAGIGAGAITPLFTLVHRFRVDLAICTDDGFTYWREGAFAVETGLPVIVVNHAVSEEAGMAKLARHLQSVFPDVTVHHIPQRCTFTLVGG